MTYESFYKKHNRCKSCMMTYSKNITYCLLCGSRLATKRRSYAKEYHSLKESRRAHMRI